ncbi:MAG TPA: hypothetical protein EYP36_02380 [Calditrichaeota bacterium]|nr:hypothetical protein [Calditrichota bacterium]
MEKGKKLLLTAIGAPHNGYEEVNWTMQEEKKETINTPLPLVAIASQWKVDEILILGTPEALDEKRPHYRQLLRELERFALQDRFHPMEIGALNTRDEFWQAFKTIIDYPLFKQREKVTLFVDLTFGYRIQPILIFLAAYFLNETVEPVELKKVYYGMDKAEPPRILNITELLYLLDWLKSVQMFTQGGSAKILADNISYICQKDFQDVAKSFREFADAYAFNYVSDLKQKAANFQKEYNNKNFRKNVRNEFPVFDLIHPYVNSFIKSFLDEDEVSMQLNAAKRNFEDEAYARAVIILREVYVTFFMTALNLTTNEERKDVEEILINRIYFSLFSKGDVKSVSETDKKEAQDHFQLLVRCFGQESLDRYYENWGGIRELRNNSGHIRKIDRGDKNNYYSKFESLKEKAYCSLQMAL